MSLSHQVLTAPHSTKEDDTRLSLATELPWQPSKEAVYLHWTRRLQHTLALTFIQLLGYNLPCEPLDALDSNMLYSQALLPVKQAPLMTQNAAGTCSKSTWK